MANLDVYRDWLGINDPERPLNYYQLLKVKKFEDDSGAIRSNYRKLNAHVRKYSSGEYAQQSQDLLNEIAKAMLCLTDSVRKGEYDVTLGRKESGGRKKYTFEEILIGRKVLDAPKLEKARNFVKAIGVELKDAVLQQKLAPAEGVMQAYAESIGLPYVDLAELTMNPELLRKMPAVLARSHSCAPLLVDDGRVLVVSTIPLSPEVEEQIRLRFELQVRTVICTPAAINDVVNRHYTREQAAAEMAAGSGQKAAPKAAAKGKSAQGSAAAGDPDAKKGKILGAILGFCLPIMATVIVMQVLNNRASPYLPALIAGGVGTVLGWLFGDKLGLS